MLEQELSEKTSQMQDVLKRDSELKEKLRSLQQEIDSEILSLKNHSQINDNSQLILDELTLTDQRLGSQIEALQTNHEQTNNQVAIAYKDIVSLNTGFDLNQSRRKLNS